MASSTDLVASSKESKTNSSPTPEAGVRGSCEAEWPKILGRFGSKDLEAAVLGGILAALGEGKESVESSRKLKSAL